MNYTLVFTILSAVAEAERNRIRERIASVKAAARIRGTLRGDGSLPGLHAVPRNGHTLGGSHMPFQTRLTACLS